MERVKKKGGCRRFILAAVPEVRVQVPSVTSQMDGWHAELIQTTFLNNMGPLKSNSGKANNSAKTLLPDLMKCTMRTEETFFGANQVKQQSFQPLFFLIIGMKAETWLALEELWSLERKTISFFFLLLKNNSSWKEKRKNNTQEEKKGLIC